jgi:primosomal protein N' (replication factor Y) (superfamily II helicase)
MLAHVVVLRGGRGRPAQTPAYAYAVPPSLVARLAPGQLVSVPFGSRLVPGIVWALDESERPGEADGLPAATRLRELSALLDPAPLLGAERMALAEWLADRYSCSLAAATQVMLSPGLVQGTRVVLRPAEADVATTGDDTADAADAAPNAGGDGPDGAELRDEAAVLGALRARGWLDERAVGDTLGAARARAAVSALLSTGAATRETLAPAALTGRRRETRLRLVGAAAAIAAWRDAARAELDRLVPLAAGGAIRAATTPAGRDGRRAERILRQLAVLDLLGRPAGPRAEGDAGGMGGRWRLNEVRRLTRVTSPALAELEQAGLVALETVDVWRDPLAGRAIPRNHPLPLTPAQRQALDAILRPPAEGEPHVVLLHGVTGSGKTEVYLQALAAHLAAGRRGIVLVPEIALTPQAMTRFAGRFPGRVALLHSGLTDAERLDEWRRIRAGLVDVVVGSRSALFAPVERLGLIVVDEEHEAAYKQEGRPPTYHARDAAVELGRIAGATVVLGSATPSVESFWQARRGTYRLVELSQRAPSAGARTPSALPPVMIVDLRAELRQGNTSILGAALQAALGETLAAGQQAVLFLNRRGTASSVICRECGYVALCGRCDVPLTYHAAERSLLCHYCGQRQPAPLICPHCWGASIRYFGVGTERVEAAVKRMFPRARVLRWDRDTARTRHAHEQLLAAFAERRADVLVGTQMIAKGLDLPAVTLVGVVSADVALYLPDFRASERAFQLLTQVAGRAGRGEIAGRVIVQTFNPEHFCIQAAARHDYHDFYAAEVIARERYGYPPFRQFTKFTYTHRDRYHAQVEAMSLADRLERLIREQALEETDVVGPAPAFMERLRGYYRWQLIARGPDLRPLLQLLTPDDLPHGWSVDVDPASTL